jgi:hypothetical protein
MKRLTSIIIAVLAAAAAYAQAPQDSTVNIIARWKAGEKYAYEYSQKEIKIVNGDTTEVSYTNAIHIYEILEETETSYKVSVSYKDEYSSDPVNNLLSDLLTERYGDPKVIFTTNQYGTLQSIDNIQELSDQIVSIIDDMVKILINVNEETPMEQVDMLKEQLKTMFSNHDTIMQIFAEDIGRVLYFHGCGMKLDEEYTGQIQVPSIYPGVDQLFPADVTIWADSEFTDEYSTVCRSYTTVSNEEFKNVIGKTVINNLKTQAAAAGLSEEDLQAALLEVEKTVQSLECNMEEYSTAEIHNVTGWPLNVWYDKDAVIKVEDQNQIQSTSWTLKMIIPSDEE